MTPTLVGQMVVGAALVLSVAPITAAAQAAMPRDQLRDLTTDRPDTTESPFTIDPGHVQIETTLFGYARAPRDGSVTHLQEAAERRDPLRRRLEPQAMAGLR